MEFPTFQDDTRSFWFQDDTCVPFFAPFRWVAQSQQGRSTVLLQTSSSPRNKSSILFYSILFYSILFYSILFYSIYSLLLLYLSSPLASDIGQLLAPGEPLVVLGAEHRPGRESVCRANMKSCRYQGIK